MENVFVKIGLSINLLVYSALIVLSHKDRGILALIIDKQLVKYTLLFPERSFGLYWHKILASNPYPDWHKSTKKGTLFGTIVLQKWFISTLIDA